MEVWKILVPVRLGVFLVPCSFSRVYGTCGKWECFFLLFEGVCVCVLKQV